MRSAALVIGGLLVGGAAVQAQADGALAPEAVSGLQSILDQTRAQMGAPGLSLGIVTAEGQVLGLVSGFADREGRLALEPSDRMLSGSVGKTYFAALAMQLIDEGVFGLDDRVADHLGELDWYGSVPNNATMTVRQLLKHTSGLNRYVMDPQFTANLASDPLRSYTTAERMAFAGTDALFEAGEGWSYADTNFILLAELMEVVTGREAYAMIRERFLEPMELAETTPSDQPAVPGLVMGFAGGNNPFGGFDETLRDGQMVINPQFEWAGGGFASSARDLARWIRSTQTGGAFPLRLLGEARSTAVPAPLAPQGRYGLGMIGMTVPGLGEAWGHSGFMPGYMTEAYHFVDQNVTLVLMVNASDPSETGGSLLRTLIGLAPEVLQTLN